ncbi:MAG: ThiF family adenylyltransferase [Syntrophobacter sp.]
MTESERKPIPPDRYSRQRILSEVGDSGQRKLAESSVLIAGCGALGGLQADLLARAGVGKIRLVDRDFVELSNLQRQILFDEKDAERHMAKVEAASARLHSINSEVETEPLAIDITSRNVENLLDGVDLVLDGTDNFETRYLINDACIKHGKSWVYGGVIGTIGMVMLVEPRNGACLRCLVPDPPSPGSVPTCDTSGVLNGAVGVVASLQATTALRFLTGAGAGRRGLVHVDPWNMSFDFCKVLRDGDCPCCGRGEFEFLEAKSTSWTTSLCGRNSVQVSPPREISLDLAALRARLERAGMVEKTGLLLMFKAADGEIVIFPDGRAMIMGTTDVTRARGLYAKYVGI